MSGADWDEVVDVLNSRKLFTEGVLIDRVGSKWECWSTPSGGRLEVTVMYEDREVVMTTAHALALLFVKSIGQVSSGSYSTSVGTMSLGTTYYRVRVLVKVDDGKQLNPAFEIMNRLLEEMRK